MRKVILMAFLIALAAPVAAMADTTPPTAASTANQTCKLARTTLGAALFGQTYGTTASKSNAYGKCVAANLKAARQAVVNAQKTCKAQQADPNFAAGHGGKTFNQFYGSNSAQGKGSAANAYGKCVSLAVSSSVSDQVKAIANAAKSCKAARRSDAAGFAGKYGTGQNAFAKCVAAAKSTS